MEIVDRPKNQSGRIQKSCQYCSEYNDKASKGLVCCVTHTHPAIITQELFEMAQAETQRRKDEKDAAAGTTRYAEAKNWLDEFRTHMQAGGGINTEDALILRSVVEKIIVLEDRISIHLRCGIICSGVL